MKTLLTGLLALGLTIHGYSQSSSMVVKEVKLENVVLSPSKNVSYINTVESNDSNQKIQNLETEVGTYDITKSQVYKNDFDTYEVLFNSMEGKIVATYDESGRLMNTYEKFENITLPENVRNAIYNEYPDWTVHSTVYRVNYYNDNDVNKVYNVQIMNHQKKLNLKVNPDGLILNHNTK